MFIEEILIITPSAELSNESDALRSALIVCFEEAVERGLSPQEAMAIIVEFGRRRMRPAQ
jgi:hypothetical protein